MNNVAKKVNSWVPDIMKFYQVNKSQAKSIAWAEYFEEKLAYIEAKYQGNFDPGYKFDCYCFDCKQGNQFLAPDSIKLFIREHKDHKTKTRVIK